MKYGVKNELKSHMPKFHQYLYEKGIRSKIKKLFVIMMHENRIVTLDVLQMIHGGCFHTDIFRCKQM